MHIDWAALGQVFGVSLAVTVGMVGVFTLGIVGTSRKATPEQGGTAATVPGGAVDGSPLARTGAYACFDGGADQRRPSGGRPVRRGCLWGSAHSGVMGHMRVDGHSRPMVDFPSQTAAGEEAGENPARSRHCHRGAPSHRLYGVTARPYGSSRTRGWKTGRAADPGARRLSPPVTSNQGADPE